MRGAGEKRSRQGVEKETCGVEVSPWESIGIATVLVGANLLASEKWNQMRGKQTNNQTLEKQKQDFDLVLDWMDWKLKPYSK